MKNAMQLFEEQALKLAFMEKKLSMLKLITAFFSGWSGTEKDFPENSNWLKAYFFRVGDDDKKEGVAFKMSEDRMIMGWVESENDNDPGWYTGKEDATTNDDNAEGITADNIEKAFLWCLRGMDIRFTTP